MEIHNILVPTDFSTYAEYAFQQALVLAMREKAYIRLLHVLPRIEVIYPEGLWLTRAQLGQELQTEVEQRLETMAAMQPVPIETLAVWGNPVTEICRIATAYNTDLIVMSKRKRNRLSHIFMGSVTERVVRSASCSVLIVRTFEPKAVCVDQSPVLRHFQQHSAATCMVGFTDVVTDFDR